jgi:putative transposase
MPGYTRINNRCKQHARQREQRLPYVKSPGHTQCLLVAYGPIAAHFRPRRHVLPGYQDRQEIAEKFQIWWEITDMTMAASGQDEGQPSCLLA